MSDTESGRQREGTRTREGNYPHVEKHTYHYFTFCGSRAASPIGRLSLQPRSRILATVMVFQKCEFPRQPETTDNIEQALNDTLCSSGGSRSEFSDYVSVLEASLMFKTGKMVLVYLHSGVALEAGWLVVHREDGDADGQGRTPAGDVKSSRHEGETVLCGLAAVVEVVHLSLLYLRKHNRHQKSSHTTLILFLSIRAFLVLQRLYLVFFLSDKTLKMSF